MGVFEHPVLFYSEVLPPSSLVVSMMVVVVVISRVVDLYPERKTYLQTLPKTALSKRVLE